MKKDRLNSPDQKSLYRTIGIASILLFFLLGLSVNGHSNQRSAYAYNLSGVDQGNGPGASWKAPSSADALKNPYKGNTAETEKGKALYEQMCVICHGKGGKGDGPAGIALNPRPADHTSAKVQDQSDGALFWKMTNGNPPMAAYKDVLSEEQRWDLVNYIRTLKKK